MTYATGSGDDFIKKFIGEKYEILDYGFYYIIQYYPS